MFRENSFPWRPFILEVIVSRLKGDKLKIYREKLYTWQFLRKLCAKGLNPEEQEIPWAWQQPETKGLELAMFKGIADLKKIKKKKCTQEWQGCLTLIFTPQVLVPTEVPREIFSVLLAK